MPIPRVKLRVLHCEYDDASKTWTATRDFVTKIDYIMGFHSDFKTHPKLKDFKDIVKDYEKKVDLRREDTTAYLLGLKGGIAQKLFCRVVERTFRDMPLPAHVIVPEPEGGSSSTALPKIKPGVQPMRGMVLTDEHDSEKRLKKKEIIGIKAKCYEEITNKLLAWRASFESLVTRDKRMVPAMLTNGQLLVPQRVKGVKTKNKNETKPLAPKPVSTSTNPTPPQITIPATSTAEVLQLRTALQYEKEKCEAHLDRAVKDATEIVELQEKLEMLRATKDSALDLLRKEHSRKCQDIWSRAWAQGHEQGYSEGKISIMEALIAKDSGITCKGKRSHTPRSDPSTEDFPSVSPSPCDSPFNPKLSQKGFPASQMARGSD